MGQIRIHAGGYDALSPLQFAQYLHEQERERCHSASAAAVRRECSVLLLLQEVSPARHPSWGAQDTLVPRATRGVARRSGLRLLYRATVADQALTLLQQASRWPTPWLSARDPRFGDFRSAARAVSRVP